MDVELVVLVDPENFVSSHCKILCHLLVLTAIFDTISGQKYGIAEMCRDQWKWASNNP